MEYVYHSSKKQGLKSIEPRVSTHGKSWIYAMKKPEYCLMFLGNHGDIINQTGLKDGVPFIAERFKGALKYAYKDLHGSIYTLEGADFKTGQTTFSCELVCDHICDVVKEEKIENALEKILQLESKGKITIYRYPTLPSWMPNDKSDLVEKVVEWARKPGSTILEKIKQFHPDILDEVTKKLSK